ncbi:MAG: PAS domain S-box protein [Rhodospirillaceae bacterium]
MDIVRGHRIFGDRLPASGEESGLCLEPAAPAAAADQRGEMLRLAFTANPDALVFSRLDDGRLVELNDAFVLFTGCDRRTALGRTAADLSLWADRGTEARFAALLRRDGEVVNLRARLRRRDGAVVTGLLSARMVEIGRVPHVLTSVREIGALVAAKRKAPPASAAEAERRLLVRAVEQAPVTVVLTDAEGVITWVNDAFCRSSGYSRAEAIGVNPRVLKSGYTAPGEYERLWATLATGHVWRGEFHNRRKSGELHWEAAAIAPVRDETGAVTHFLAVKDDITARKAMEGDLLNAKEAAESASRAKSTFLAHVSHELRTPLNAIIGFAEIMDRQLFGSIGDSHYRDYARYIGDSGRHLLALINDILDLSKVEAGRMDMTWETVDIAGAVDTTRTLLRGRAEAGRVLLIADWAGMPPPALNADGRMVRQILLNIVSNAVKFTPPDGRVTISGRRESDGGFALLVADTGKGMDEGDLIVALTPFGQSHSPFLCKDRGSGLGLPLAKSLAELHGGSLTIASAPRSGTTVTVRFPPERVLAAALADPVV